MKNYTTTAMINAILDAKEKAIEEKKIILTNDAYALREILEVLCKRLA